MYTRATMPDWDGYYRRDQQADHGSEWIWGMAQAPTVLSLLTPLLTQVVIDKVIVHQTQQTLWVIAVAMVIATSFGVVISWARQTLLLDLVALLVVLRLHVDLLGCDLHSRVHRRRRRELLKHLLGVLDGSRQSCKDLTGLLADCLRRLRQHAVE